MQEKLENEKLGLFLVNLFTINWWKMHVGGKISNLIRGKKCMLLGILVNSSQTYGSFEKQRELPVFQKEQIEKKR